MARPSDVLSLPDVLKMTGLTELELKLQMAQGQFPRSLFGRPWDWSAEDVEQYIKDGGPPKTPTDMFSRRGVQW